MVITKNKSLFILFLLIFSMSSCVVSKKKYEDLENRKKVADKKNRDLRKDNKSKNKEILSLNSSLKQTREEYNDIKNQLSESNAQKSSEIDKLSSDLLNMDDKLAKAIEDYKKEKAQLESEQKIQGILASELAEKEKRIADLEKMINTNKEKINLLKNTIAEALNAFDNSELTVHQKDGKVYVSLDEQLLFKFGSAKIEKKGVKALKKLAEVLEKNQNIDITIEGHTDNIGSSDANWDLSVKRATSIVKILQKNSEIAPERFTASGKAMYHPLVDEDTKEARQKNRRTEIILTPKLDELYKLLDEDVK